jgi:hypothetical protein
VDQNGCNVFNRAFIAIEHEGFGAPDDDGNVPKPWTEEQIAADIALKQWVLAELKGANVPFPIDSIDRLTGHLMFDKHDRANCPGPYWPRERIFAALTGTEGGAAPTKIGVMLQNPNFRSGPGTEYPTLVPGGLVAGTPVTILGEHDSWYNVVVNGVAGWVFGEFIGVS